MASTTSADDWPGQRLDHVEFGRTLAARRAALGNPEMPRNAGNRRTPSKRALLQAIADAGGTW